MGDMFLYSVHAFILENWVMLSIGIQFVLSVIFIFVAVRAIDPMKKKY